MSKKKYYFIYYLQNMKKQILLLVILFSTITLLGQQKKNEIGISGGINYFWEMINPIKKKVDYRSYKNSAPYNTAFWGINLGLDKKHYVDSSLYSIVGWESRHFNGFFQITVPQKTDNTYYQAHSINRVFKYNTHFYYLENYLYVGGGLDLWNIAQKHFFVIQLITGITFIYKKYPTQLYEQKIEEKSTGYMVIEVSPSIGYRYSITEKISFGLIYMPTSIEVKGENNHVSTLNFRVGYSL